MKKMSCGVVNSLMSYDILLTQYIEINNLPVLFFNPYKLFTFVIES